MLEWLKNRIPELKNYYDHKRSNKLCRNLAQIIDKFDGFDEFAVGSLVSDHEDCAKTLELYQNKRGIREILTKLTQKSDAQEDPDLVARILAHDSVRKTIDAYQDKIGVHQIVKGICEDVEWEEKTIRVCRMLRHKRMLNVLSKYNETDDFPFKESEKVASIIAKTVSNDVIVHRGAGMFDTISLLEKNVNTEYRTKVINALYSSSRYQIPIVTNVIIEYFKREKFQVLDRLNFKSDDKGKFAKALLFKDVLQAAAMYRNEKVIDALFILAKNKNLATFKAAANLVDKEVHNTIDKFDEDISALIDIVFNKDKEYIKKTIKGLQKYGSDLNYVLNKTGGIGDIDELLTSYAYEQIKKSKNPREVIELIYLGNYSSVRKEIDVELNYHDLYRIKRTLSLVNDIHEERNEKDIDKIKIGFYAELNRAISQSDSYNGKVKNARKYCAEVEAKMKDNASDLMVITDGS